MNVSTRSVLGVEVAVLIGALTGFGAAWSLDEDPQPATMHQVGEYDFFIYVSDPESEDDPIMLEYGTVGRAGFGMSWPVEEGAGSSLGALVPLPGLLST